MSRSTTPFSTPMYIDPPERLGADADVSWWIVDDALGSPLEACLHDFVPTWIQTDWPFARPRFIGRDITWAGWLALPGINPP